MDTTWKVGALAEASGVTVRTLHHWDEVGLLLPSRRGPGGRREYAEEDLARLYVVLVLRDLGLSLESIGACLDARVDPQRVLGDQLAQLDRALEGLGRLRERVARAAEAGLDGRHVTDPAELLRLMRDGRPKAQAVLDRHLSGEQRDALADGAAAAGPALPHLLEVEWPRLYRRAEELRRAGAQPGDERVQRIVARLDELSATLAGGAPGAGGAVRRAWRDDPASMSGESEQTAAPWRELADFVEQARMLRRLESGPRAMSDSS